MCWRQANTEWFRTWLLFDPAVPINKIDRPILVVHGALDREMPTVNADRLEQLALARKGVLATATKKVVVPAVNHLLVPAKTGEPDEYDSLPSVTISPDVVAAIVEWLNQPRK